MTTPSTPGDDAAAAEAKAGAVLDRLIAEKVMGWTTGPCTCSAGKIKAVTPTGVRTHWSPSTSIADAWEVAEMMTGDAHDAALWFDEYEASVTFTTDHGDVTAYGNTVPMAICRAALAALAAKGTTT